MSLKVGIVGLPNVGKSTLFNALLGTNLAAASNFPFCTIEPNTGIVPVPDARLNKIAELEKSEHLVPATIEFVDIAGLVAGASTGAGLGNKFLTHIREVDAIVHVVRTFVDENITHVTGSINPTEDIKIINLELILADLEQVGSALTRQEKAARGGDKEAVLSVTLLNKCKIQLEAEQPIRKLDLTADEQKILKSFNLLTLKPILYVANVAENQLSDAELVSSLQTSIEPGTEIIPISAKIESELVSLEGAEREEYLESIGLTEPGLHRLIKAAFKLLGLITYLTAGPKEARAWTISIGMTAPQAAGVIHTDFEKGFIRAEITSYEDFVEHGGWNGARTAGRVRSEGKTYVMQDGDVTLFRFNV